jgi:hypothetical protein
MLLLLLMAGADRAAAAAGQASYCWLQMTVQHQLCQLFTAPAAFFSSTAVGGVFRMNVKLRSCSHQHTCSTTAQPVASGYSHISSEGGAVHVKLAAMH